MLFKRRESKYVDAIEWTGENLKDVQTFMYPQSPLTNSTTQLGINVHDPAKQYGLENKLVFAEKGSFLVRDEQGHLHVFARKVFEEVFEAIDAGPVPIAPPHIEEMNQRYDEGIVAGENYHG